MLENEERGGRPRVWKWGGWDEQRGGSGRAPELRAHLHGRGAEPRAALVWKHFFGGGLTEREEMWKRVIENRIDNREMIMVYGTRYPPDPPWLVKIESEVERIGKKIRGIESGISG